VNLAHEHGGIALIDYLDAVREARSVGVNALSAPYAQTCLVATLGLLPAAMSHGIGSDSQRPFAIVIVGGLIGALAINVFLLPTLYVWIARDADVLSMPETEFAN
jgi:cobalt-zinc-cadmium resistance protein CzcA